MARIAINGLGRIGRSILRLLTTTRPEFEVVALNDIAAPDLCAYLLRHDSVFGNYPGDVRHDDGAIYINDVRYPLTNKADLSDVDLSGVDLVMDCTGKADARDWADRGLRAGAGKVLISGPSIGADQTVVLGANSEAYQGHSIVSCASCTTNALAPLARLIDREFGLITAHMTTIHCYTGSQPTVDAPRGDLVRSRAAALSMVPTTTSAGRLTDLVLPDLAGRIFATSVRVPTASVSAIDMSFQTDTPVGEGKINDVLRKAKGEIIGVTEEPLVSSDLRARPESIIMALPETHVTNGGMARVFGWYDNEWGFSNRMIDLALRMVG